MRKKRRVRSDQAGQGLVEYLVLTCLVAVAAMTVVSVVGRNIREHYTNISRALTRGDSESVTHSEVDKSQIEARGMHDYMRNSSPIGRARQ